MPKMHRLLTGCLAALLLAACAQEPAGAYITSADLAAGIAANNPPFILDVRTAQEFDDGHVPGAVNISHTELEERIGELENLKDETIVVYCRSGGRAQRAAGILGDHGFANVIELEGHMSGWRETGFPVE